MISAAKGKTSAKSEIPKDKQEARTEAKPEVKPEAKRKSAQEEAIEQALMIKTDSLLVAKALVMATCPYVQKRSAKGLTYTFASEADIIAKVHQAMVSFGVLITPSEAELVKDEEFHSAKGAKMRRAIVRKVFTFTHVWTGQYETAEVLGESADIGDKAISKAQTIALKYALRQWLLIETGDDPDFIPAEDSQQAQSAPQREVPRESSREAPKETRTQHRTEATQNGAASTAAHGASGKVNQRFERCLAAIDSAPDINQLDTYRQIWEKSPGFSPDEIVEIRKADAAKRQLLCGSSDGDVEYQDDDQG